MHCSKASRLLVRVLFQSGASQRGEPVVVKGVAGNFMTCGKNPSNLVWIVIRARTGQSRGSDYSKASSDAELSMQFEQALSVFKLEDGPIFQHRQGCGFDPPPIGYRSPKRGQKPPAASFGAGKENLWCCSR